MTDNRKRLLQFIFEAHTSSYLSCFAIFRLTVKFTFSCVPVELDSPPHTSRIALMISLKSDTEIQQKASSQVDKIKAL